MLPPQQRVATGSSSSDFIFTIPSGNLRIRSIDSPPAQIFVVSGNRYLNSRRLDRTAP